MIDLNKKYKTRSGKNVDIILISDNDKEAYPVLAFIDGGKCDIPKSYTIEGYYNYIDTVGKKNIGQDNHPLDLIEVEEYKETMLEKALSNSENREHLLPVANERIIIGPYVIEWIDQDMIQITRNFDKGHKRIIKVCVGDMESLLNCLLIQTEREDVWEN